MSIKIDVVVRVQDNMDGGYSIKLFNTMDEMLAAHPAVIAYIRRNPPPPADAIESLKNDIINGDDEYEYGYITKDSIELEQNADGSYRLAKPISFHVGQ